MLRRNFLLSSLSQAFLSQGLLSSTLLSVAPKSFADSKKAELDTESLEARVAYVAAAKSRLGESSFVCLDANGKILVEHDIPSRGHSFAYSNASRVAGVDKKSGGHIAAIARRPADFCLILDHKGQKITEFSSEPSRHFYGHGVYSPDGGYLYLTENDFSAAGAVTNRARGVIGVYDATNNYKRVAEFDSAGIGPHEIALTSDGETLIIANGGIQTHPESGRKKLNLDSMEPNLAFLDRQTGRLKNKAVLDAKFSTNSIRHITVADNDHVYVALQQQVKTQESCLVAHYDPGTKSLSPISLSDDHGAMLEGYVGDIALDNEQQCLSLTSPYGNVMLLVDLMKIDVQAIEINDVCGISSAKDDGQFIATSGDGSVMLVTSPCSIVAFNTSATALNTQATALNKVSIAGVEFINRQSVYYWDNHITAL